MSRTLIMLSRGRKLVRKYGRRLEKTAFSWRRSTKAAVHAAAAQFYTRVAYRVKPDVSLDLDVHGNGSDAYPVYAAGLGRDSVVYSFGVGCDISFELSVIERFGAEVYGFDPTEQSERYVRSVDPPKAYRFQKIGIGGESGQIELAPLFETPAYLGGTILGVQASSPNTYVVEVRRFIEILEANGHEHVDFLKMDIEGAEYGVLDDMLKESTLPDQIALEFHPHLLNIESKRNPFARDGWKRTIDTISRLRGAGYRLCFISGRRTEFLFVRETSLRNGRETGASADVLAESASDVR